MVDHQAWLADIPAQMPVRAPLRMVTYSVDTGVIKRGPDHYIAGVTIVVTDDSAGPSVAVQALTPDQARSLAGALLRGADDAQALSWSVPEATDQELSTSHTQ
ncbi:hypothetical protein V3G39_09300 [Dermatophilaceae bacterium Sec6.4]